MIQRILIIGGYGNFGSFITKSLAKEPNIQVIIAGRSLKKAQDLASNISTFNPAECVELDINLLSTEVLSKINPNIVIHTSGPFQSQSYDVAKACMNLGCHYIDLADGRDFVSNVKELDSLAKKQNSLVISGASSVPCLTSAIVDHYKSEFLELEELDYGITTAQKTARGLATTAAILGYTGKPFETLVNNKKACIYGWQGIRFRKYKKLGWRLLGNCDIPDLELFPNRYEGIKTIRFYAGLEIPFIHVTLWVLSWLVRVGLIKNLQKFAPLLLKTSFLFDWLGSSNSAFHMQMTGTDNNGRKKTKTFELTARSGDGPYIPCMPAILIAKKIVNEEISLKGAYPCTDFITLDEYLEGLKAMDISWEIE